MEEKNIPENTADIDTVSGDNENKYLERADVEETSETSGEWTPVKNKPKKKKRSTMSKRTKKRLTALVIVTVALLLVLGAVLTIVTILNNRPPEFSTVRDRFEKLITDSQAVNEMIWGAGLPTYKRVVREIQTYEVDVVKEDGTPVLDGEGAPVKKTLRYYLYEDAALGTVVSYEYQVRVSEGKTNADGIPIYTIYDVENGGELAEYKNGAARFAQKSQTVIAEKELLLEKNGYYYYALPNYQNEDLAYAEVYSGEEDSHYDYVRFDQPYKNTDDVKGAIEAVYSNAFMAPLYETLFTGMVDATNYAHQAAYFDYIEADTEKEYLMKSNSSSGAWKWRDPLPKANFDFSTMQMVEGNARTVTVSVDYTLEGSQEIKQMEIEFVLENDAWLLNTPTFG